MNRIILKVYTTVLFYGHMAFIVNVNRNLIFFFLTPLQFVYTFIYFRSNAKIKSCICRFLNKMEVIMTFVPVKGQYTILYRPAIIRNFMLNSILILRDNRAIPTCRNYI